MLVFGERALGLGRLSSTCGFLVDVYYRERARNGPT
jgi:hypothetical protein